MTTRRGIAHVYDGGVPRRRFGRRRVHLDREGARLQGVPAQRERRRGPYLFDPQAPGRLRGRRGRARILLRVRGGHPLGCRVGWGRLARTVVLVLRATGTNGCARVTSP